MAATFLVLLLLGRSLGPTNAVLRRVGFSDHGSELGKFGPAGSSNHSSMVTALGASGASSSDGACHLQLGARRKKHAAKNKFCSELIKHRYHNKYCDSLPAVSASEGCDGLVDLNDYGRSWMPQELRTITLWGDSLMDEIAVAFRCLLSRAVGPPSASGHGRSVSQPNQGQAPWSNDEIAQQRRALLKSSDCPRCEKPIPWTPRLQAQDCGRIGRGCVTFGNIRLCYVRVKDNVFVDSRQDCQFLHARPSDVFVFNVGLWHNSKSKSAMSMGAFSQFVHDAATFRAKHNYSGSVESSAAAAASQDAARGDGGVMPNIVWMETPPQHFKGSPGGHYSMKAKGCNAKPMLDAMRAAEFRNKIAEQSIRRKVSQVAPVHIFETWEHLLRHSKLHVQRDTIGTKGPAVKVDCSHWCQYEGNALGALSHMLLSDVVSGFWR